VFGNFVLGGISENSEARNVVFYAYCFENRSVGMSYNRISDFFGGLQRRFASKTLGEIFPEWRQLGDSLTNCSRRCPQRRGHVMQDLSFLLTKHLGLETKLRNFELSETLSETSSDK
jgi:hypothetical protein